MAATRRVLIIDDEATFTRLVKMNLEAGGAYEVREEHQGVRGLAAAQAFRPDVILLDVIMPDLDGPQVAAQLAADAQLRAVPIIFLTATAMKRDADAPPTALAGRPVIPKPVSMPELRACLERCFPS